MVLPNMSDYQQILSNIERLEKKQPLYTAEYNLLQHLYREAAIYEKLHSRAKEDNGK